MKFEKADKKQIDKIVEIELKSFYKWTESKGKEEKNVKELFDEGKKAFLIKQRNAIIGYLFYQIKSKYFHLEVVSLEKKYQGKGLGKKILKELIEKAKKEKCKGMFLEVWAKNFPAIGLYNKFKFVVIEIKKKHYPNKDDKLVMKLEF